MLSMAPVTARMGRHYYSADNYYTRGAAVERSEWFGKGCEKLGLSGAVSADVFQELLEGKHPLTKAHLTLERMVERADRRAAMDLTFSVPKSVSIAALVGGDERLFLAHERAVNAALSLCEERYSQVRAGGVRDRRVDVGGNLIVAKFNHDTSRAKDPQLHTHCVAINAVQRADGEWRSLHNDGIYHNSRLLGLYYQNELARQCTALGYEIETRSNGTFEVCGYSEEQLRAFSKRREKIEELSAEKDLEGWQVVKIGREAKGREVPREILRERWENEARLAGIEHPKTFAQARESAIEKNHCELVLSGLSHATERDVSFRREQIETHALESKLGQVEWKSLQHSIDSAVDAKMMIATEKQMYTTANCLEIEQDMLAMMRDGKGATGAISEAIPERIRGAHLGLTHGQREALEVSLSNVDRFVAWQGVAGAGKTFAINILREEAEIRGWTVRGFAPSAEAAKVLETESRIPSATVASVLVDFRREASRRGSELWIVDESGLMSAHDCREFMVRAQKENAKVIFVGDTRQLSSVGAGNAFKLLQDNGIAVANLNESRRQKTEEVKEAVKEMSVGNMRHGLEIIGDNIAEFRREATRIEHATNAYMQLSPEERSRTLVLAGTNRERKLLTESIRNELKQEGSLGECVKIASLKRKEFSSEELRFATKISPGDVVTLGYAREQKGLDKGVAYEVVRCSNGLLTVKDAQDNEVSLRVRQHTVAGVFERVELEVSLGDKVRWTRNDKVLGVRNGQDAEVAAFDDKSISLRDKEGKVVTLGRQEFVHVDHNYVNTVYSSQGKTCDNVIVCTDETFGKEAMYVAVSRAKLGVKIFCEDREKLFSLASESRAKVSAMDIVKAETMRFEKEMKMELGSSTFALESTQERGPLRPEAPRKDHGQNQAHEVEQSHSIGM